MNLICKLVDGGCYQDLNADQQSMNMHGQQLHSRSTSCCPTDSLHNISIRGPQKTIIFIAESHGDELPREVIGEGLKPLKRYL
ncbi:MAG: hypothetical protein FJZ57_07905 [Chlamydiae bacterium]|nr:hypothetical protein [Chlamydiota bacterium]